MRRATLVQGGITRLLNMSVELGEDTQNKILNKYMKKLQTSGYNHKERLDILKSIKNGWHKILKKAESGERPLHRNREFNKEQRRQEKEDKKLNWFKGKNGNSFESVMMIPATPGSELKNIIENKAKSANLKIKVDEKTGPKLDTYL